MFINILCLFWGFAFTLSVFDFEIPYPFFVLILTGQARVRKIPQKITQAQVLLVLRLQKLNFLFCVFDVLFVKFLDGKYEFCGVESVFKNEFENLVIFGNFDILCKFIGNRRVVFQPEST